MDADGGQIFRGHGNGVACREEDTPDPTAIIASSLLEISLNIRHRTHFIWRTLLVDHAEGALVVRTTYGSLDQQAVCLAWRAVYRAFIVHALSVALLSLCGLAKCHIGAETSEAALFSGHGLGRPLQLR
jgi:hypothetical protein